jgi:hypothetical protein
MTMPDTTTSQRCSWCAGPLPAPIKTLAVVHGTGGTMLMTCLTACLTELVSALAGRSSEARRYAESRRN